MIKPKLRRLPLAAAALVACMSAHAGYQSPDGNFTLSGFGTLGVAKSSTKDALFNYPGQGTGVTTTPGITPDSKIAAQGTYKFANTVSATGQVMTKTNAYGDYQPQLEWAFGKWQIIPSVALRVGRMGAPYFAISDFRDVGYANPWVRPPLDVYGQVPVSQFEGFDLAHQTSFGPLTLTSTLWVGDSHAKFAVKKYNPADPTSDPSDVDIKKQIGLNFNAEIDGGWSIRLGHVAGKLSASSTGGKSLVAGLKAYQTTANALGVGQQFQDATYMFGDGITDRDATFSGLAVTYDPGDFVASLEYTKRTTDTYVSDSTGWYGTFGYRVGRFTPYIGLSKIQTDQRGANPLMTMAAPYRTLFKTLVGGAEAILNTQKLDDKTTTLGVRWEAASGVAVKAQYDFISKPADAQGVLNSGTDAFVSEARKVRVLSLSVDFVF